MHTKKDGETCVYPKSTSVLKAARLRTIEEYILWRRHTTDRTIATQPILEEQRGVERQHRSQPHLYWWEQDTELVLEEGKMTDMTSFQRLMRLQIFCRRRGGGYMPPPDQRDGHEIFIKRPAGHKFPLPKQDNLMEGTGNWVANNDVWWVIGISTLYLDSGSLRLVQRGLC